VTSASTGQAKIAATTHRQLLVNTAGVCNALGLTADDVHLSLFGVIGHPHELFMRGLWLGGSTVLTEHTYPRNILEMIAEGGVTALMGLPPQLDSIGRLCSRDDIDISSLRIAEAGGMHVSAGMMELFMERTGVDLVPVWGSTETSGVVLLGEPGSEVFTGAVDGYTLEIRDPDGIPLEGDARGELWVSGEGVVSRYLGDRSATSENLPDGWYRTGDLFLREEGKLRFLGRRGGLIKAAGLKVYPLEVELAILLHPDVDDVCVVGTDHPARGEIASAFILLRPGREVSASAMRYFLQSHLDEHKIPRMFSFVHTLPRTPGGKIDRKAVGKRETEPDYRGEILRSDVELVRLLCLRADLMDRIDTGFDPTWVQEQVDNAIGHNPGPVPDGLLREIIMDIVNTLGKR
jgi:acyl-CoA synthetase (AMP-forming)/AMP-acid ligase II